MGRTWDWCLAFACCLTFLCSGKPVVLLCDSDSGHSLLYLDILFAAVSPSCFYAACTLCRILCFLFYAVPFFAFFAPAV